MTNPVQALQRLAGQLQHAADSLGARLAGQDLDSATALAWTKVLRELRQSLEGMERLGIAQKQVQLSEQTGVVLAWVVRTVLERIGLDQDQAVLASTVVPAVFREASSLEGSLEEVGS